LRAVHLSFEFDQKINEISLGVPVTLQLLKIVPRPPNGIRPTGVMRTVILPSGGAVSQPRQRLTGLADRRRLRQKLQKGPKRMAAVPITEPGDLPALG
jgi:hypothetical protein